MNTEQLKHWISRLGQPRLLVLGDFMIDQYLWGAVERISPEAPVQVVGIERENYALGGAGNVAHNLAGLGAQVMVASVTGEDEGAQLLRSKFGRLNIHTEGLFPDASRATTKKTRVFAVNQQVIRLDREQRKFISPVWEARLLDYIRQNIAQIDGLIVSDYAKGVLTPALLREVIALSRQRGIPVLVDPKGEDYRRYTGATMLTPNLKEAAQAARTSAFESEAQLVQAGNLLRRELQLEALLITRSKEGMTLFQDDGAPVNIPARAREIYDVSGAGDTVIAVAALGICSGLSFAQAACLANLAAGIVVGKLGVATVSREELHYHAEEHDLHAYHKIKSVQEMQRLAQNYRSQGKKTVFTFGCFDVLTIGVIKFLQKSRSLGHVLIVGLHGNGTLLRLRNGAALPGMLLSAEERAHIVCALDCVDFVVIDNEDTPESLISRIQPQIVVRGEGHPSCCRLPEGQDVQEIEILPEQK